jgi:hypothetical protein
VFRLEQALLKTLEQHGVTGHRVRGEPGSTSGPTTRPATPPGSRPTIPPRSSTASPRSRRSA